MAKYETVLLRCVEEGFFPEGLVPFDHPGLTPATRQLSAVGLAARLTLGLPPTVVFAAAMSSGIIQSPGLLVIATTVGIGLMAASRRTAKTPGCNLPVTRTHTTLRQTPVAG